MTVTAKQLDALVKETSFLSSVQDMQETDAYKDIKAIEAGDAIDDLVDALDGPAALPAMVLLADITGENPAEDVRAGDVAGAIAAWKTWAADQ